MKSILVLSSILVSTVLQAQYFQQEVHYNINVRLDDKNHILRAQEEIEYINHSDSTLTFLYFHLWPNAYKNNETAMAKQLLENGGTKFYFAKPEDRGYIDSLSFTVDGIAVKHQIDPIHIDYCKVYLNKPLAPGGKIKIATPFKVKIPKGVYSRLGHMGESYQITQWYPKPAVFDYKGWHPMPYLTNGEFYSEFGSFNVQITLPKNYIVGATGDLQTQSEVTWLDQLAEKGKNTTFLKAAKNQKQDVFPPSEKEYKTIVYTQKNVHDFAWFADKRWHVLKGEVELPNSKKKVTTWSMFTDAEADLWSNSIEYINDAIYYYSLWNGDYQYNQMTAVDGALSAGSGMEYPNITVIGGSGNALALESVIMHETGHQWFYGMLGSNERDHAWMDEGINTSNEIRYLQKKYPEATLLGSKTPNNRLEVFDLNQPVLTQYYIGYNLCARRRSDQAIETTSSKFTPTNYGTIVYMKTGLAFYYLRAYLGDQKYDQIMQKYFDEWKFKHPYPEDVRRIFEQETNENLAWIFDDLIKTDQKIDFSISRVQKDDCKNEGKCYCVHIKNKGDIASPFSISSFEGDSLLAKTWYSWPDTQTKRMEICINKENIDRIELNADLEVPELNLRNNRIRTKGLFRRIEPIKLQPMFSLENRAKTQILYTPITTWNNYDRWTLGVLVNNSFLPSQAFEYQVMPLYSFSSNRWSGLFHAAHTFYLSSKIIHRIQLGMHASSFSFDRSNELPSYYEKIAPYVDFTFKKPFARSHVSQHLRFQTMFIREYMGYSLQETYHRATYEIKDKQVIAPSSLQVQFEYKPSEFLKDFLKSTLTAQKKWVYNAKGSSISARVFAGMFWFNNSNESRYNLRMDGVYGMTSSGAMLDYTYDHLYLGRSETSGILSQQFSHGTGDFKIKTPLGQSNDWITSLNIEANLPFTKTISLFADFGYSSYKDVLYDGGVSLHLLKNSLQVYIPLVYSQNIKDVPSFASQSFGERIRFVFAIESMNPFQWIKEVF